MTHTPDPRVDLARAMSMAEVMERLPLPDLKRLGRERVGACPKCGGRDRFAINLDMGVFNCRICQTSGDPIALTCHVLDCDFLGAIRHLAGDRQEISQEEVARRRVRAEKVRLDQERASEAYRQRAISDARAIWARAVPITGTPAQDYLALRGVDVSPAPPSLRYLADHPYVLKVGRELRTLHRGPCMIAAIQNAAGDGRAVHQTWIDLNAADGKACISNPDRSATGHLKAKLVRGSQKGCAIRLGGDASTGTLVIGEGIETALSARVTSPYPAAFWASINLGNLSGRMGKIPGTRYSGQPDMSDTHAFEVPDWVRRLVLIKDGDSDPDMTRAHLMACAHRARHRLPNLSASIIHPGEGCDLNDLLRKNSE